jgi:hypothetical protein
MREIKVGSVKKLLSEVNCVKALIIPNKFKEEGENRPDYVMFPC